MNKRAEADRLVTSLILDYINTGDKCYGPQWKEYSKNWCEIRDLVQQALEAKECNGPKEPDLRQELYGEFGTIDSINYRLDSQLGRIEKLEAILAHHNLKAE